MNEKQKTKPKRELSDVRLLQVAEIFSLCSWGGERLKDLHFNMTCSLEDKTDDEIDELIKRYQPFFMVLKQIGDDSDTWISFGTKRALEYYNKDEKPEIYNRLDKLFKKEGSMLGRYIPKK